jgi:peroxiredoxin
MICFLRVCLLLFAITFWPFFNDAEAFNALSAISGRPAAKPFALKDGEGRVYRLADARGKVVLVNFWATWCPPCRKEMPSMERLWKRLADKGFVVYALDVGESADDVESFVFDHDLTFPVLLDKDAKTIRQWQVRGLPSSFLVDSQGRLAYKAIGERDWDDPALEKTIRALIGESP